MQVKCSSGSPTIPDVSPYIISPVFWERCWEIEGMSDGPFTRGWLNDRVCQILTTNNKSVRESITKKKLAFEVAKLVSRHVVAIRVGETFAFIDRSLTSTRVGRTRLYQHHFRKPGLSETGPRLEGILATRPLVRGCWSLSRSLVTVRSCCVASSRFHTPAPPCTIQPLTTRLSLQLI